MTWMWVLIGGIGWGLFFQQWEERRFFERQAEFWYHSSRFWSNAADKLLEIVLFKNKEGEEWKDG